MEMASNTLDAQEDSIKVNNWNNTGVSGGYDWYCDAVRNYAWYQIDNPAGFTIDWKLKTYEPVDSAVLLLVLRRE